jgi:hypothetical protein
VGPANGAQHFQAAASRHLEIKNYGIRVHVHDGTDSLGTLVRSPYKLNTRYLLQQIGKALHDYLGVIGDKNSHPISPGESGAHT